MDGTSIPNRSDKLSSMSEAAKTENDASLRESKKEKNLPSTNMVPLTKSKSYIKAQTDTHLNDFEQCADKNSDLTETKVW